MGVANGGEYLDIQKATGRVSGHGGGTQGIETTGKYVLNITCGAAAVINRTRINRMALRIDYPQRANHYQYTPADEEAYFRRPAKDTA